MLIELDAVLQVAGDSPRRWFTDDFFDLIVWYGGDQRIVGFQLCYDKGKNERALSWRKESGYTHHAVDDGETPGHSKMAPILVSDGYFDSQSVAEEFKRRCSNLDEDLRDFVLGRLDRFSDR